MAIQTFTLLLHVQPGARKSEFAGRHGDALKVRIAAPPVNNRANAALIAFLSGALDIQKSAIVIRQGTTSRRKLVDVTGDARLAATLNALHVARS